MGIKYTGTYDELQKAMETIPGEWKDLSGNQKQFRSPVGGVMNWFPSTGTINFQGKAEAKEQLENEVTEAITAPSFKDPVNQPEDFPSAPVEIENHVTEEVLQEVQGSSMVTPPDTSQSVELTSHDFIGHKYSASEIVIGLVGAVGTELIKVVDELKSRLQIFDYIVEDIRISSSVIPKIVDVRGIHTDNEFERISRYMDCGNDARKKAKNNSILALGAAKQIGANRTDGNQNRKAKPRHAYIINSLKHPDEVSVLREIYSEGFYLLGVYSSPKRRRNFLIDDKRISGENADTLMNRDEDEHLIHGQRTTDTFHLSDFFIHYDGNSDKMKKSLWRILDVIFGHPYTTPTFDEYAMFMAFSSSLRSADLSRQVGAVVTKNKEILSTGANDCPKAGGGLYWPRYDKDECCIVDDELGRDYKRGEDSNTIEKEKIFSDLTLQIANQLGIREDEKVAIIEKTIRSSTVSDITEYGRVVHAEMEALLSCSRNNVDTRSAKIYCTTFPCHNCAKHIVASGISEVVYIEPYPKSKAADLFSDSITLGIPEDTSNGGTVSFKPFVGVGPRRFFDLFSLRLGSGYPIKRKDKDGNIIDWNQKEAKLRIQMLPFSYLEREKVAGEQFELIVSNLQTGTEQISS